MRIRKVKVGMKSAKTGRPYYRYDLTIPPRLVRLLQKAGWKLGQRLKGEVRGTDLIVNRESEEATSAKRGGARR